MYAVMGLGVLAKGPIGVLLPMAVIGMYLLCTTPRRELSADASRWERIQEAWRPFGPRNFFRTVWMMRPLTAIAMVLLVAGPWYVAAGIRTDGAFLEEFFVVHHLQRATSAMDGHSGPIFYYVPAIWAGMFPWSIFAVPALILWMRHLYKGNTCSRVLLFITCWVGVYVGVFSLASTKLPNYVLPAYPAVAMMIGYFIDQWIRNPEQVHRRWLRGALVTPILVGLAIVVLLPASGLCDFGGGTLLDQNSVPPVVQRDIMLLGLVGLPLLLGGAAALAFAERGQIKASAASVGMMAILTMICLWTYAAPRVSRFQSAQNMAQWLREENTGRSYRVAQYRFFRPSMVFYSGHPIESRRTPEEIQEFILTDEPVYVITDDYQMRWLQYILPADFEVVRRTSQFPEDGEILVLTRPSHAVPAELPASIAHTTASDTR
jgi:4-amino-4-deoxy-L-arabinose transferase-like glycosyltransferase